MTAIATVTTELRHRVRLLHASTGAALGPLSARLQPALYGWSVRALPDIVVVSKRADVADPAVPPQLALALTDAMLAQFLQFPAAPGQPPHTVVVTLNAPVVDRSMHAVPMTLTVILTTPSTGAPRTGRTVVVRAITGPNPKPTVALPETAPGVYRSAAVEWGAAFTPGELLVGGQLLRTVSVNFSSTTTRIHLVDTT